MADFHRNILPATTARYTAAPNSQIAPRIAVAGNRSDQRDAVGAESSI
jgi:hypothetical protein